MDRWDSAFTTGDLNAKGSNWCSLPKSNRRRGVDDILRLKTKDLDVQSTPKAAILSVADLYSVSWLQEIHESTRGCTQRVLLTAKSSRTQHDTWIMLSNNARLLLFSLRLFTTKAQRDKRYHLQSELEAKSKRDSPNQGSNLGPYPGKRIHILLFKARCEGYVITATLSGPTNRLIG